jgi:hypothetical protein
MKPAIDVNKHANDHGSSLSQPSPATVVLMLVVGSGVVRSSTGMFSALISLR